MFWTLKPSQVIYKTSMAADSSISIPMSEKNLARISMVPVEEQGNMRAQSPDSVKDEEANLDAQPDWKPSRHELAIMLTLAITSMMISLDATIVVTTIEVRKHFNLMHTTLIIVTQTMIVDLKGTATEGFWIGTSYLLTCAVTMPFTASLSDIFGRPICLLVSLAIFTIGTIICCVAQNLATLIGGRCVQGVGGGGIIILGLVIFTDIVPLRFRSKYYGIM